MGIPWGETQRIGLCLTDLKPSVGRLAQRYVQLTGSVIRCARIPALRDVNWKSGAVIGVIVLGVCSGAEAQVTVDHDIDLAANLFARTVHQSRTMDWATA